MRNAQHRNHRIRFHHASMTENTCYTPVATITNASREIRLLRVLPGTLLSPIKCELFATPLDTAPTYEAISYAWGKPDDKKIITVNGARVGVPSSLEQALQHLRDSNLALLLWADSVCIDQKNDLEKASQVAMMGSIFRSCSSVYIWLGVPQDEIHLSSSPQMQINPFSTVLHFAEGKHIHELPCFRYSRSSGGWYFQRTTSFDVMWSKWVGISTSSWWSRLWCVQESLLAPSAIVVSGRWRIPLETWKIGHLRYKQHVSGCCSDPGIRFPKDYQYSHDQIITITGSSFRDANETSRRNRYRLVKVLRAFQYKECQDARDRVYGLVGLMDQPESRSIRPNYSLSVGQIFLATMKVIMRYYVGDLRYLTGSGFYSQKFDIPSWVRNFANPITIFYTSCEMWRYEAYDLYNASASIDAEPKCVDEVTMSVEGTYVDSIEEVCSTWMDKREWEPRWRTLQEWHRIVRRRNDSNTATSDLARERGPFWRTVMADVFTTGENKWRRITVNDELGKGDIENSANWPKDAKRTFLGDGDPCLENRGVSGLAATNGRTMFWTKKGSIGLCFPNSLPGDEIWVLHGGKVPFVLRPCNDKFEGNASEDRRYHNFIGEAYLHGYMDGEAVKGSGYAPKTVFLR